MKIITQYIIKKWIKDHDKIKDPNVRARYGQLEGWVSIVINLLLFSIKIILSIISHSISLMADAIHTLSDTITSVVIIIGFRAAKKPSDQEHPFGHGRVESVTALIIAVLLFVVGIELVQKSIQNFMHPQIMSISWPMIGIVFGSLLVKELMARFAFELGDIIDSDAIAGDAFHHRSDVLSTFLVMIALIGSRYGYHHLDGVMGILVSLIIFYSAYVIGRRAIDPLLGEAPSEETIKAIDKIARGQHGVLGIHDIICHQYGQTTIVSLHIEVSDKESVNDLHDLSEQVEQEIVSLLPGGMAIVHIDPINKDHPQYDIINKVINDIIQQDQRIHSFHELRIIGQKLDRCNVIFDIVLKQSVQEREVNSVINTVKKEFHKAFPSMKIVIKVEPRYAYNYSQKVV